MSRFSLVLYSTLTVLAVLTAVLIVFAAPPLGVGLGLLALIILLSIGTRHPRLPTPSGKQPDLFGSMRPATRREERQFYKK
jgi:hypothetical protein